MERFIYHAKVTIFIVRIRLFQKSLFGHGGGKINYKFILPVLVIFALTLSFSISDVSATTTSTISSAEGAKTTFTTSEINIASSKVKTFIEGKKRLPTCVYVGDQKVPMPQFLTLMTRNIAAINKKDKTPIPLKNINTPSTPSESIKSGTITKTEYITITNRLNNYFDKYGKAPNYTSTTLGTIRFENLIYTYTKITTFYKSYDRLPNTVSIKSWKSIMGTEGSTTTSPTTNTNQKSFTISQISTSATNMKNYVEKYGKLPCNVTVNNVKITTPQFLQLLSYAISQLNSGSSSSVTLKNVNCPTNPTETVKSGTLTKSEYVKMAQNVKSYISSNGRAPNNVTSSLGKIRFESLVYIFSKTMNFYRSNKRLPNTLSVTPWNINLPITGDVATILNTIGRLEAQFEDIQGQSSPTVMEKVGYGDCWADSLWLYIKLTAASIQARIMGYVGGGFGVGYRHAWVQINVGNGWTNWNYNYYNSQHFGDVNCGTPCVLIGPGVSNPSIVATGY